MSVRYNTHDQNDTDEYDDVEVVEPLGFKRVSIWLWFIALAWLVLAFYFPLLSEFTFVPPLVMIALLLFYSVVYGTISLAYSMVIAIVVGVALLVPKFLVDVKKEAKTQLTQM